MKAWKVGAVTAPGIAVCVLAGLVGAAGRASATRGALCALTAGLGWLAGALAVVVGLSLKAAAAGIRPQPPECEVLAHVDCGWTATPGGAGSQIQQALAHWRSGECKVAAKDKEGATT